MIQIRLWERRSVDPEIDPLGRSFLGWDAQLDTHALNPDPEAQEAPAREWNPAVAWERARLQALKTDRALSHQTVEVIDRNEIVLAVVELYGVTRFWPASGSTQLRFALEGDLINGDPRLGKESEYPHTSHNPVMYFDGVDE